MIRTVIACVRCHGSVILSWTVDLTSFKDAVMAFWRYQAAEAQLYQVNSIRGYPESADEDISFSSESMSLDLGEMWRYGSATSPDWDSEVEVSSVEEEVIEDILWVTVRAFLVPDDVFCMRTTAVRWNIAGLYGPCAELFFFLMKKDGKNRPLPPSQRPRVRNNCGQIFGFDSEALGSRLIPDVQNCPN